jgi:hypothetical protein
VDAYMDLLNANDFGQLIQLFLPDGALQPPFQKKKLIVGCEAILSFFREECQNLRLLPERGFAEPAEGNLFRLRSRVRFKPPGLVPMWA